MTNARARREGILTRHPTPTGLSVQSLYTVSGPIIHDVFFVYTFACARQATAESGEEVRAEWEAAAKDRLAAWQLERFADANPDAQRVMEEACRLVGAMENSPPLHG